jgi:CheY-like chemotaxis protein
MTVRLVIFMLLACLVLDYLVRQRLHHIQGKRERLERAKYLSSAVRLEFADDAASLKRVEVHNPRAWILAVDDEKVVLDSFRRILVLEGCNIDTVETGPEALSLLRRNDYDFLFTDLKMPRMDGVEVVKAAKHLRPDVDVVVITAYGTIETAVEAMSYGACQYMQKPFSADELAEFIHKILAKRQARHRAMQQPMLRFGLPSQTGDAQPPEDVSQGGSFIADGHTWVWIESDALGAFIEACRTN